MRRWGWGTWAPPCRITPVHAGPKVLTGQAHLLPPLPAAGGTRVALQARQVRLRDEKRKTRHFKPAGVGGMEAQGGGECSAAAAHGSFATGSAGPGACLVTSAAPAVASPTWAPPGKTWAGCNALAAPPWPAPCPAHSHLLSLHSRAAKREPKTSLAEAVGRAPAASIRRLMANTCMMGAPCWRPWLMHMTPCVPCSRRCES